MTIHQILEACNNNSSHRFNKIPDISFIKLRYERIISRISQGWQWREKMT